MGYDPPQMSLFVPPCHFLLAQKVTNPDPVSLRDGSPMLLPARPAPRWAKRLTHFYILASATHCALYTENQYLKFQ